MTPPTARVIKPPQPLTASKKLNNTQPQNFTQNRTKTETKHAIDQEKGQKPNQTKQNKYSPV